ncbi:hypothetical protein BMF94_2372 [Rhodotorula taiwanensis]|uniref:Major facilitator superfamily (MFS) profile domain-containing protein n=1 Tax=Rhodotorula taiwanensis TaxID=741276 RepID=A0A2S5BCZ5_9BASI|nr:hypothetical protein BMF94_2372 [Rhodotorula taiwanensis]
MLGPFSAAAVIPSFETFVEDFGITITQASYFVSVPIVFLGVFPLVWSPVSKRIGRRPVLLASALLSAAMHFAAAYTHSYGALMTTRVFQAIFISPPQSIGANMVGEMFFQHEKGAKLGIWTLLTSLGPPVAPLIMGPLVYQTGKWQWTFWLLACINLGQFVLYIFLAPETAGFERPERAIDGTEARPLSSERTEKTPWWHLYFKFRRVSSDPWSQLPIEVVRPLAMVVKLPVILPTLAYSLVFAYCNVLLTVEIPSLLGRKYNLNAQQIGLQFVGAVIHLNVRGLQGAVLGEIFAGTGSDWWMVWRTRRASGNREPEYRLPFGIPGVLLALQNTPAGAWNVTPIVGVAIALFGTQLVTTVVYAYAVESQPAELQPRVPGFIAFARQLYAFTAPFYLNIPYETLGYAKASGLLAGLAGGVGVICLVLCLTFGRKWRAKGI